MASDIETYLRELQTALVSAGADPALVQDALFDAEEHLQAEMAAGGPRGAGGGGGALSEDERTARFAAVAEGYGSPEEVAAAYLGVVPVGDVARAMNGQAMPAVAPAVEARPAPEVGPPAEPAEAEPAAEPAEAEPAKAAGEEASRRCAACGTAILPGQTYCHTCGAAAQAGGYPPTGVQYGMQAAGAGFAPRHSVWWEIFSPFADGRVWTSLLYMILSLATGIAYFTIVVTGLSTAGGMLVLIVGIPLFLLVLAIVRGLALFEGRLVETLLGTRMPRRLRPTPPDFGFFQRMLFWLKDGRTWASMAYMLLMLPLGIAYFTIAVTGLAVGVSLATSPIWGWAEWHYAQHSFVVNGIRYDLWPLWAIPIAFVGGVLVLIGFMHLVKWIGRGHAAFAKAMLVRLK